MPARSAGPRPGARRAGQLARRLAALALAPVTVAGLGPVGAAVVAGAGVAAVSAVVAAAPKAKAASVPVLVLVQNGETTAPETTVLQNAGYSVTQVTPSTWQGMPASAFGAYAALVIGDPSSGGTCSTLIPTTGTTGNDALGASWQAAVTGNVAVLGTAPAAASTSAANTLISDAAGYAAARYSSSSSTGTGLYVSLNCEYSNSSAGTGVPLLNGVEGIGTAGGLSVQGGLSCSNPGTVNTWEADASGTFGGGFTGSLLSRSSWPSPGCPVQEAFDAWPSMFTPVGYDAASDATANFTASDGAKGQPYLLLGAPVTAATQALAPSAGGEVPAGTTAGGAGNPAAPGVAQATAGDPVNTENGDFTQSATDLSIPAFGPSLVFTRTYDAQVAQQQTQAGTPGQLGYGWTDNWASSLTSSRPVPGDVYTLDGLKTDNGDGGPATLAPLSSGLGVLRSGGDLYIADTYSNRVQEVAGTSGTQWGISMTAGDVYTIAGSGSGVSGRSGNGGPASSALLSGPWGLAMDSAGDLYIADTSNNRIQEIAKAAGTQWGQSMTAGDIYTIAGSASGTAGLSGDGGPAASALLSGPQGLAMDSAGDLYIADTSNNRIQEIAKAAGTQWGQSMTAGDIYTIAGSASGTAGLSGDGGGAGSALLHAPAGVAVSGAGDIYIADTSNNRIQEIAKAAGTQWGQSMTAGDIYTIAGSASGTAGLSGDGGPAASALLVAPGGVTAAGGQLYIADTGNNRVQEAAGTSHTEWGISMTAGDVYTITGSAAGSAGFSGDGGPATSAHLSSPSQVALDSAGNIYIGDDFNDRVRQVTASTAVISTFAGNGGRLSDDGNGGPATGAGLRDPGGVATDPAGNVYIADTSNNRIQEIAASGHTQFGIAMVAGDVYTIAGSPLISTAGNSGDGGPATAALLRAPGGVAADAAGDIYIADAGNNRIQEIAATSGTQWGQPMTAGDIYTIAGSATGTAGHAGDGGAAGSALLNSPDGVGTDRHGDIYIADTGNNRIQEIAAATGTQWGQPMTGGDIYTITGSATGTAGLSGDGGPASAALLSIPAAAAADPAGNIYIADTGNNRIQELATATGPQRGQQMTAGDSYTVAGSPSGAPGVSGDGGPASAALLNDPASVGTDSSGNVYIADENNNRIQEIAAVNGTQWATAMTGGDIYTVAGSATGAPGNAGDGGPAASALMQDPDSIAADPSGNLFLTNLANDRLREITATSAGLLPGYPTPGGVTITQPGGAQITFYPQAGGACTAPYVKAGGYCALPQDVSASLTFSPGTGTYTFTPSPGSTYTYNSSGALTGQADAAGNQLTIGYGTPPPGSGHCPSTASWCETITAASGRVLVIGLTNAGQVTSVTDPLGRTWTYGYTGSDLTSVTDPMGNKTTYTYGTGSTGNPALANDLLTITDPNAQPGGPDAGDSTVNTYNTAGQVTTQTDPMGFTTTFDYTGMNPATGTGIIRVGDPDGNTTVYDYTQGALAAKADWTGTTLTSEQDLTPDVTAGGASGGTLLDTTSTDGNGNTTSYTYDASGNTTTTTAPNGVGSQTGTTTAQFTSLNNESCKSAALASTSCSASQHGPTPVAPGGVITPPSSAPPQGVTYTLYDTNGNELYSTTGVYGPGSNSASYLRTTYQLFKGNSVTLNGNNITCTNTPPSPSVPCATINADAVVTQLQYDAQGDLSSSSVPDGNGSELATTTYAYNADGEQTSTISPDGHVSGANAGNYTTTMAYNADGQKTSVAQAGGSGATVTPRTTSYGYDANGNQTTEQDARGYTTTTAYNADDKATLVTDPDGNAALTCYDGDGQVAQTVPPAGVAANGLTQASCPTSYPSGYARRLAADATTSSYDVDGHQTATTSPAPAGQSGYETTTYTYDGDGNLIKTTAPANSNSGGAPNQVTLDTYNAASKLSAVTTGYGTSAASTTSYCYDPNGDRTAFVAPDGNTSGPASCQTSSPWAVSSSAYPVQAAYQTASSYDSVGELVSTTTPDTTAAPSGATTTDTYDPAGNMLTSTDPNGIVTTWTYTPGNRKASVSYSGSSAHSVTLTYDANGQQTGMTDATGSSSQSYDPFGELTSATNGAGQTTGYGYNADGKATAITYPLPGTATWPTTDTVTYGYDHADKLTSFTDFNGNQISITNNADGRPSSETLGSTGDTIAISYDQTGHPLVVSLKNSSTTLQSFSYSDAPSGDILSETDTPSSPTSPAAYTYDAAGRVTSMTAGTGSALNYSFDASSNLTSLPLGATATYDNAGELTSAALAGITTNYAYNADGERLTAKNGSTTVASGTWNGTEQLTAYSDSTANMSSATYDGNGLRGSATTMPSGGSAITQDFAWNTTTPVPQLLMDSANAYLYGPSGTPAEQVNLSTGGITYLVQDSLGSVRGIVSSSGALTASTAYDAWGNPNNAGGLTSYTPFGYAGGYTDSTGLLYLVSRYYDPAVGQFLSVDPLVSSTLQAYSYGGGNPVGNTDPHGTSACGVTHYGGWALDGWFVPSGLFGGCVYGQGLYVWGMSAGFVGYAEVCGWHYYWTAYWWGYLRMSWWAPYHSGCNWNNNGNYNYWWSTNYWYAHAGPFDAQLWATDPWGKRYRLSLISEWVS